MSTVSTTKMTARQFLQLGEDPAGVRLELVNGEIAVSPSARPDHSNVEKILSFFLIGHIRQHDLGRLYGGVDTIFGEFDVRRPDLLYFQKSRLHLASGKAIKGMPDLCVEIVSPSSKVIDRVHKFEQYAAGGVPFYWIIDPVRHTIEGWELKNGEYVLVGSASGNEEVALPPFPNLRIPLKELWHPE